MQKASNNKEEGKKLMQDYFTFLQGKDRQSSQLSDNSQHSLNKAFPNNSHQNYNGRLNNTNGNGSNMMNIEGNSKNLILNT